MPSRVRPHPHLVTGISSFLILLIIGIGSTPVAHAATVTWSGGGADANWQTNENWAGGTRPSAGDNLVFPAGATQLLNINDFPTDTGFAGIRFEDNDYSISGSRISLGMGGITAATGVTGICAISTPIALAANQTWTVESSSATLTVGGLVTGSSDLTKAGAGKVKLTAANTYTGATFINVGNLQVGIADAVPGGSAVMVASGATLDLNGFNDTVASLTGQGSVTLGTGTLTTGGDGVTYAGVASGTGGMTKTGTGTATFSGDNTYSGSTTINAGTLVVNGSQPSSSTTVNSSATLAGTGTVGSLTSVGGTVKTGPADLSTLNATNTVSFNTASRFVVRVDGSSGALVDKLNVNVLTAGSVTLGNALLDIFIPAGGTQIGDNYYHPIVSSATDSSISGNFDYNDPNMGRITLNDGDNFVLSADGELFCRYQIKYFSTTVIVWRPGNQCFIGP